MMNFKSLLFFLLLWPAFAFPLGFIENQQQLAPYRNRDDILMIASPGRSGSTLLTKLVKVFAPNYIILKTHILPPSASEYRGKIIFIYSNPDKAAESALHLTINNQTFGARHFSHLESSDKLWFSNLENNTTRQNEKYNLLSYDALGCFKQLFEWLGKSKIQSKLKKKPQILAIKYENLWDFKTVSVIKKFLGIDKFELPPKKERGYTLDKLDVREIHFRKLYNLGTLKDPRYAAYDKARALWYKAPPFQLLNLQ